jgi:hypothetical protein
MNIIEIIVCIVFFGSLSQSIEGWKGIVPLRSTRVDVERLLGAPSSRCKGLCRYESKDEVVFVRYSGEPCNNEEQNRWRVPPDTVIDLTVNLGETPKLSDLKLNLKKFKRTQDPELHGYSTYKNEDRGVSYAVSSDGRIYSIDWFATTKDNEALRCPSIRSSISTENVEPVFDTRNSIGLTFGEDKPRIDQFARNLKKMPHARAYIIAYGVDLGFAGEASMRLMCIRDYLINIHHIRPSRLVTIDGGYANKVNVELFLVRPGDPKPKPAPTRNLTAVRNIKPRADPCM